MLNANRILKNLVKRKYNLQKDTDDSILNTPSFGIKLYDLQTALDSQLLNNTIVFLRSDHLTAKVLEAAIEVASKQLPISILKAPIPSTAKNGNLVKYISQRLYTHDLSFRSESDTQSDNLLLKLDKEAYNDHWKSFKKYKLYSVNGLAGYHRTQNRTKSFSTWANSQTTSNRTRLIECITTPTWYQEAIKSICPNATSTSDIEAIFNVPPPPVRTNILPDLFNHGPNEHLDIWTDGSHQTNKSMASASIYSRSRFNQPTTVLDSSKPKERLITMPKVHPSSETSGANKLTHQEHFAYATSE